MPTPRPEISVISAAVEMPEANISSSACSSDSASSVSRGIKPRSSALRLMAAGSMPRPSSVISMTIRSPTLRRRDRDRAGLRLSGGGAGSGRLDAMVERVANHMQQRFEQTVDDRLVGLRRLAARDELNLLVEPLRQVAHQAGKRPKHLANRHHAQMQEPHHGNRPPAARSRPARASWRGTGPAPPSASDPPREMGKTVLQNDQFAGKIDQGVDPRFRHAKPAARGVVV